jgi:hypothetical protein
MMFVSSSGSRAVVLTLILVAGCVDAPTDPTVFKRAIPGAASIVESDGFYQDPSDGKYFWDFTEPEGEPAIWPVIGNVTSFIQVPRPGTTGWVSATVYYSYADAARIKLRHDLYNSVGTPIYTGWEADSDWRAGSITKSQGCGRSCSQNMLFTDQLQTSENCGIGASVSGQASAAFGIPFGISFSMLKPSIQVGFGWTTWKPVHAPVPSKTAPAYDCDSAPTPDMLQCDNENTPEFEYCPAPGDPANTSAFWSSASGGEERPIANPQPGGATREYCEWTHYWVSDDGGNSWRYSHSEFNGCQDVM